MAERLLTKPDHQIEWSHAAVTNPNIAVTSLLTLPPWQFQASPNGNPGPLGILLKGAGELALHTPGAPYLGTWLRARLGTWDLPLWGTIMGFHLASSEYSKSHCWWGTARKEVRKARHIKGPAPFEETAPAGSLWVFTTVKLNNLSKPRIPRCVPE